MNGKVLAGRGGRWATYTQGHGTVSMLSRFAASYLLNTVSRYLAVIKGRKFIQRNHTGLPKDFFRKTHVLNYEVLSFLMTYLNQLSPERSRDGVKFLIRFGSGKDADHIVFGPRSESHQNMGMRHFGVCENNANFIGGRVSVVSRQIWFTIDSMSYLKVGTELENAIDRLARNVQAIMQSQPGRAFPVRIEG